MEYKKAIMEKLPIELKTGYILAYKGNSFLSTSIEWFMNLFREKTNIPKEWIPSHFGSILLDKFISKFFIGESVWPRYKVNDLFKEYQKSFRIYVPIVPFTEEEEKIGAEYIMYLSTTGAYQWWKYPAYIWYSITHKTGLFAKKGSDWNTVCYESATRVASKMRPSLFTKNFDFEKATCFDVINNPNFKCILIVDENGTISIP